MADFDELLATFRDLPPEDREQLLGVLLDEAGMAVSRPSHIDREIAEHDRIERALLASQAELAEANHRFQLVLDTIPARVFWKDIELRYLGANRRFATDAGLVSPHDLIGKTDYEMPWADQADRYRSDDSAVLETLEPKVDYDEPQAGDGGEVRWLRTSKFPLRSADGTVMGVLGTYQDVTDRKRLQEQLRQAQKMEAIGQLAGGVAHDFNNLLTGILGNAELLASACRDDADLTECVRDILVATRRASDLTQQLLAFSRKGRLQTVDVDLHQLARQTGKLVSHGLEAHIDVELDLQATPPLVHGDPTQLGSALLNLALNARDAMPRGGILRFKTTSRHLDAAACAKLGAYLVPGRYVELAIEDTGVGIAPELRDRVFEPFFTTKKPGEGTGLGLAAVFGTVEHHGGLITLESTVGVGTTFRLLLPSSKAPLRRPTPVNLQIATATGGHVLVVDDEEVIRNLTARALRKYGYEVTTCADGLEAVAFFQTQAKRVDLVLLDLVMPRQDGATTLRQLVAIDPDVRVLLASGFSRERAVDALIAQGAKGFLAKPFRLDELAREVAFHIRKAT